MKILLLLFIFFNTLFSSDINENKYLGSSYSLAFAFEESCLQLVAGTQLIDSNKHIGGLIKVGFCDKYNDDTQDYLLQTYTIGFGTTFFTHDIYRDSFIIALTVDAGVTNANNIFSDTKGGNTILIATTGLGYQWHFKAGYIVSFVTYFSYTKPIIYDTTIDSKLNSILSEPQTKTTPTILLGWRF